LPLTEWIFLPHNALKTLNYSLIQSHLTYGIQAWGNGNTVKKLQILQICAVRIINNNIYIEVTRILFLNLKIYFKLLIYTSNISHYGDNHTY